MNIKYTSKYLIVIALIFSIFSFSTSSTQAASNETKYVDITSGTLTVRSGPGTNFKKVGALKKYKKVTVYNTKSGWSEIKYNKKKAYVSSKYLVNVYLKNSRGTYTIKDSKGSKYKVYMIAKNEQKAKAVFYSDGWNITWAGAAEGDTLYKGDYKLYLRKNGSNKITYTGNQKKDFIYNKTRHMIYSVPSKYKGQPDIYAIAEVMSSNFEEAQLYIVKDGKLKKVSTIEYTQRLKITGKNTYQIASYDNSVGQWYIDSLKLDTGKSKFKYIKTNKVNTINSWRKDWK
ncbi:SH3 domain-containing protein [Peribacillus sp. NPDC097198]|uniref:SH3 domain-containing protein n=1 Tax=Peribacillus sp. NPDC097198 TaxID=3364397 RepID=UPI00381AD009